MILLVLGAAAETVVATCGDVEVVNTVPAPNQSAVPVDVRPALIFAGCDADEFEVLLVRETDAAEVGGLSYLWDPRASLVWLTPDAPLDPDTTYRLEVAGTRGANVAIPFTTGTGSVVSYPDAPAAEVVESVAHWSARTETTSATLRVTPVFDPDALSVVTAVNEAGVNAPLVALPAADEAMTLLVGYGSGSRPTAQCYTVTQWDGRGEGHAVDLPCVDVVGCVSAPGRGPGWIAAIALIFWRRRS